VTRLERAVFLSLCGAAMAVSSAVARADTRVFDNGRGLSRCWASRPPRSLSLACGAERDCGYQFSSFS